jgi:hypothetical protein
MHCLDVDSLAYWYLAEVSAASGRINAGLLETASVVTVQHARLKCDDVQTVMYTDIYMFVCPCGEATGMHCDRCGA